MRALLNELGWKYVSIIYEDSSYGTGVYSNISLSAYFVLHIYSCRHTIFWSKP